MSNELFFATIGIMDNKNLKIILAFVIVAIMSFIYIGFDLGTVSNEVPETEKYLENEDYYEITVDKITTNSVGADEVNNFIDNLALEFSNIANEDVSRLRERGFQHKYTLSLSLETYKTEKYLSYVAYVSEYTGGANVNQRVESFVFDLNKGNLLEISDIISQSEEEFIEDLRTELSSRSSDLGLFPGIESSLTMDSLKSFYVTDSDIVILFSKYEIAPGAAGVVNISLPR